jgi:hypothetical protein
MRRLKLVLGVAALMVAMLVATAAPASAQTFFFDDGDGNGDFVQDSEQEAESGDLDQSIEVTGGGDNSNQCVGTQLVGNTGNTQNVIDVVDAGDFNGRLDDNDDDDFDDFFFDDGDGNGDFDFDDAESSIEVSPTNVTSCDQQVNQAATASG